MAEADTLAPPAGGMASLPSLEQMQHWTHVIGQAQQLILEHTTRAMVRAETADIPGAPYALPFDPETVAAIQSDFAQEGVTLWQRFLTSGGMLGSGPLAPAEKGATDRTDRRFTDAAWTSHPLFDLIRQSYLLASDTLLRLADTVDGLDAKQKEQIRFATRGLVDALSPSNFAFTNPMVLEKTIQTGGENLLNGLRHMLADLEKGQLSHTEGGAIGMAELAFL